MLGSGEDQCPGLGLILHKPTETFDPFAPINMATSSDASNASSMMGESSLPFDEDVVPAIQPMPDPNALQDISFYQVIFCPILIFIHISTEFYS